MQLFQSNLFDEGVVSLGRSVVGGGGGGGGEGGQWKVCIYIFRISDAPPTEPVLKTECEGRLKH